MNAFFCLSIGWSSSAITPCCYSVSIGCFIKMESWMAFSVPTPWRNIFQFNSLDSSGDAIRVYSIGWRIIDNPDVWSRRFIGFKNGDPSDSRGVASVVLKAFESLLEGSNAERKDITLVTALSSNSTGPQEDSQLFILGRWLCYELGLTWDPWIISKGAHRPLHSLSSFADRDGEVRDQYKCDGAKGRRNFVILDDFVTRGSTLADIARAIKVDNNEAYVIGFVLAKSERISYAASCGHVINNDHIPQEWDAIYRHEAAQ